MDQKNIESLKKDSKQRLIELKRKVAKQKALKMLARKNRKKKLFKLKEGQPRFQVIRWKSVALWRHNCITDTCAICRNTLMDTCIESEANNICSMDGGADCPIAWGVCNHVFHFHCISRFLKNHHICPLDAREWELEKIGK